MSMHRAARQQSADVRAKGHAAAPFVGSQADILSKVNHSKTKT